MLSPNADSRDILISHLVNKGLERIDDVDVQKFFEEEKFNKEAVSSQSIIECANTFHDELVGTFNSFLRSLEIQPAAFQKYVKDNYHTFTSISPRNIKGL